MENKLFQGGIIDCDVSSKIALLSSNEGAYWNKIQIEKIDKAYEKMRKLSLKNLQISKRK